MIELTHGAIGGEPKDPAVRDKQMPCGNVGGKLVPRRQTTGKRIEAHAKHFLRKTEVILYGKPHARWKFGGESTCKLIPFAICRV